MRSRGRYIIIEYLDASLHVLRRQIHRIDRRYAYRYVAVDSPRAYET